MGYISFFTLKDVVIDGVKTTIKQEIVLGERDDAAARRKDREEDRAIANNTHEGF